MLSEALVMSSDTLVWLALHFHEGTHEEWSGRPKWEKLKGRTRTILLILAGFLLVFASFRQTLARKGFRSSKYAHREI